jgi:AraC-like DNA-binding protein
MFTTIPKKMKLYLKNMVSLRCILLVKATLDKLHIPYKDVNMGEVILEKEIPADLLVELNTDLNAMDLYIIEDKRLMLVEKIKQVIVEMIHSNNEELPRENYSWYISKKLDHNYTYIANLFSVTEGITIEHFIISNKIEKVKQLLMEDDLNLTQISYKLNYSSVAHLSSQFKKVTGITPSQFRQLKRKMNESSKEH